MHNRKPEPQGKHAAYQGFSICLLRNWIYVPPLHWEALPLIVLQGAGSVGQQLGGLSIASPKEERREEKDTSGVQIFSR